MGQRYEERQAREKEANPEADVGGGTAEKGRDMNRAYWGMQVQVEL